MNIKLYEQLELSISKERLDEYSKILETSNKKEIFTYYILNSELSKSLYIPIQNLEITLRNNLHNTFTNFYKTDKWYEVEGFLETTEIKKINEVIKRLKSSNKEPTSGRVISELNFGFWTTLFSKKYDQKIWSKHIKQIFPNVPRNNRNRKNLSAKINTIRYFRNRVFHFEPIFNKHNLSDVHNDILNMIKWLNTAVYDVTIMFDEFSDIYENETNKTIKKLDALNEKYKQ